MIIDKSRNVILAIQTRTKGINCGYNGGDIALFSEWVKSAMAYNTDYEPEWKEWHNWAASADGAVCDAVWEAWTSFPE